MNNDPTKLAAARYLIARDAVGGHTDPDVVAAQLVGYSNDILGPYVAAEEELARVTGERNRAVELATAQRYAQGYGLRASAQAVLSMMIDGPAPDPALAAALAEHDKNAREAM